jgi:hypothetical protein
VGCLICKYYSRIAGSTKKIILFLGMLKFSKNIFLKGKLFFCERKKAFFGMFHKYFMVENFES